jgi:hypothetical protein
MTEPDEEQEGVELGWAVERLTLLGEGGRSRGGRRPGPAIAEAVRATRRVVVRGIRRRRRGGRRPPRVEALLFVPEGFDPSVVPEGSDFSDVLDITIVSITDATMRAVTSRRC